MPTTVRYVPDHEDFGRLMVDGRFDDITADVCHLIADDAAAGATKRTGDYARSFEVNKGSGPVNIGGNPRAASDVYNSDPAAAPQEFGDRWGNEGHHTLRRAGEKYDTRRFR